MKNDNMKIQIASGLFLVVIGIFLLLNNYIVDKREKVFSEMNLELTELLTSNTTVDTTEEEEDTSEEETSDDSAEAEEEVTTNYETYIGLLEIEKIGFTRGFYAKESTLNNVKYNIKILDASSYPDEENGNVIIIGHSGNYSNSYFGNLYQLEIGDTASITYNNKKYTYQIVNIYTDTKDGTVTIYRDETKSCLTLITCTKDDDTTQTIYILELISTE